MSDEGLGVNPVDKAIGMLESKEISAGEILDDTEIPMLVSSFYVGRAERKASYRLAKWVKKKGSYVDDDMMARVAFAFGQRAYLDEAMKTVLGYYGIGGSIQINYLGLGYRVGKIVRELDPRAWSKRIGGEIESWRIRFDLDKKILEVIALISAKTIIWYIRTRK